MRPTSTPRWRRRARSWPGAAALAAAYAYGIARNHPFVDGNNRTAAVVGETFLALNGMALGASDAELVVAFQALAAGEPSEEELAAWFRQHIRALELVTLSRSS